MIFSVDFDFLNCVVLCVISGLIILGVPSDCAPPGGTTPVQVVIHCIFT